MKDAGEENGWLSEDSFENIIFFSAGLRETLLLNLFVEQLVDP